MVSETHLDLHAGEGLGGVDEPLHLGFLVGADSVDRSLISRVEERLGLVHVRP